MVMLSVKMQNGIMQKPWEASEKKQTKKKIKQHKAVIHDYGQPNQTSWRTNFGLKTTQDAALIKI